MDLHGGHRPIDKTNRETTVEPVESVDPSADSVIH
jgi:hypothetical protein